MVIGHSLIEVLTESARIFRVCLPALPEFFDEMLSLFLRRELGVDVPLFFGD
jgi:hypothetical protein